MADNQFAVQQTIDLNNPPKVPYVHQEYPKMVYSHKTGQVLTVSSESEEKKAIKKGFDLKPSLAYDYSRIKAGFAAKAEIVPAEDQAISLDDFDAEEQEA